MKKSLLTYYNDGATIRVHNKRISFKQDDEKIMIRFDFADSNAQTPACNHTCHRNKVRQTYVQMSNNAFDTFVIAYMNHKKLQHIEKQKLSQ